MVIHVCGHVSEGWLELTERNRREREREGRSTERCMPFDSSPEPFILCSGKMAGNPNRTNRAAQALPSEWVRASN